MRLLIGSGAEDLRGGDTFGDRMWLRCSQPSADFVWWLAVAITKANKIKNNIILSSFYYRKQQLSGLAVCHEKNE